MAQSTSEQLVAFVMMLSLVASPLRRMCRINFLHNLPLLILWLSECLIKPNNNNDHKLLHLE